MLECPKILHNIHKFRYGDRMYIADVDQCRTLEIDEIAWEVLDLCQSLTNEQIVDKLSKKYPSKEITETLGVLGEMERKGLLFFKKERVEPLAIDQRNLRLLIAQSSPYVKDITLAASGLQVAHYNLLKSLAKYATLYITSHEDEKLDEGVYGVTLHVGDRASMLRLMSSYYDGILIQNLTNIEFISLLKYIDTPVVVPIHATRGDNGRVINSILHWYSNMRAFDGFIVPTQSVKNFYSRFVYDVNAFYTIPWGVELDRFKPMDKQNAKNEVAEILNEPRITSMPIVGFLSRFQPEKGAGIYIKIAELLPQVIFLAVAPDLNVYSHQDLPQNLIYAGQQPRDKLPLFFNAFDIHCFPSMVGEETFGLAVLEAMACGVPPVVPDLDGLPEVVGDAGIIVPAAVFQNEIGSFAGYVCPLVMADKINALLDDDSERLRLGQEASQRAVMFTWDETARKIIVLFEELKKIRRLASRQWRRFPIFFALRLNRSQRTIECKAVLSNITVEKERPLMWDGYVQTIEEGLTLSLLEKHKIHEVEAVLDHLYGEEKAREVIERVNDFQHATSF
ncbi:glycosyltransferase [Candidatus Poribacteria bacterium]|nr:glycosyltransferase [Candidatus Poribacteria bacterium]